MVPLTGIEVLILIIVVWIVGERTIWFSVPVPIVVGILHVVGVTALRAHVIRIAETFGRDEGAVEEVEVIQATVRRGWAVAAVDYGDHVDAVVFLFFAAASEEVVQVVTHFGTGDLVGLER